MLSCVLPWCLTVTMAFVSVVGENAIPWETLLTVVSGLILLTFPGFNSQPAREDEQVGGLCADCPS